MCSAAALTPVLPGLPRGLELTRYTGKVYSLLVSEFRHVLMLDADSSPTQVRGLPRPRPPVAHGSMAGAASPRRARLAGAASPRLAGAASPRRAGAASPRRAGAASPRRARLVGALPCKCAPCRPAGVPPVVTHAGRLGPKV